MKNIPERIYLNIGEEAPSDFRKLSEVTWSEERIFDNDIAYTLRPQLISVEEKLPEDGQKVIACRKGGKDLDIWTFHKEYDGEINCFETFDCNPQWMDYWMPIPELPDTNTEKK